MNTTFIDFSLLDRPDLDAAVEFTITRYPLLHVVKLHRGPKRTSVTWNPLDSLRADAPEPLKMLFSTVFLAAAVKHSKPGNGIRATKEHVKVSVPTKKTGQETLESLAVPFTAIWDMAKTFAYELPIEISALR